MRLPRSSDRVVTIPAGLFIAKYTRGAFATGRPSSWRVSRERSTHASGFLVIRPPTATRPASMIGRACAREATPSFESARSRETWDLPGRAFIADPRLPHSAGSTDTIR